MPKLSSELLKYLPGNGNSKSTNIYEENEEKLSEAGTITKADAILIAQTLKEELHSDIFILVISLTNV